MSLAIISAEALARLAAAQSLLRIIESYELARGGGDDASRSAKGMLFVQNYAVFEFVVVGVVRALIAEVNMRGIHCSAARAELLSLALDPELTSVSDTSKRKQWDRRFALLKKARSCQPIAIGPDLFPKDGSHFRPQQLETIWSIFGIPQPAFPAPRYRGHILELVETRNRIAHGGDSPDAVGSRFSVVDMRSRIMDTETICTYVVTAVSAYLKTKAAFI